MARGAPKSAQAVAPSAAGVGDGPSRSSRSAGGAARGLSESLSFARRANEGSKRPYLSSFGGS